MVLLANRSPRLADKLKVALVTKRSLEDSASAWAQGGIASVLDPSDSDRGPHRRHPHGRRRPVLRKTTASSSRTAPGHPLADRSRRPVHRRDVVSPIGYHLTREGGQQRRRIIHAADATGAAVQATLTEQVGPIRTSRSSSSTSPWTSSSAARSAARRCCLGAYVLDIANDEVRTFAARHGAGDRRRGQGLSGYPPPTPTPPPATGLRWPWRAGCRVANMEFIQFHPPACTTPGQSPS